MTTTSPTPDHLNDKELDEALQEIDLAAMQAQAVAQGNAAQDGLHSGGEAGVATAADVGEAGELTEEQRAQREAEQAGRRERLRNRAVRQRQRGRKELERTYVGVLGVTTRVTLNDRSVASHFERFAGLIDNTLYLLARRGALVLGPEKSQQLQDKLAELVQIYADMGAEAVSSTGALIKDYSAATLEWLEPTYQQAALDLEFHVKTKVGSKLVRASHNWDKAIYNLAVLAWNDKADDAQREEAVRKERDALKSAFDFTFQVLMGLRGATQAASPRRGAPRGAATDNGEQGGAAAVAGEGAGADLG